MQLQRYIYIYILLEARVCLIEVDSDILAKTHDLGESEIVTREVDGYVCSIYNSESIMRKRQVICMRVKYGG